MGVSEPARRGSGYEIVHRLVGEHGDLRVEQGHIDVGAFTGCVPAIERGQNSDGRVDAGKNIGECDADFLRLAVRRSPVRSMMPPMPCTMKS